MANESTDQVSQDLQVLLGALTGLANGDFCQKLPEGQSGRSYLPARRCAPLRACARCGGKQEGQRACTSLDPAHSLADLLQAAGGEVCTGYDGLEAPYVGAEFRPEAVSAPRRPATLPFSCVPRDPEPRPRPRRLEKTHGGGRSPAPAAVFPCIRPESVSGRSGFPFRRRASGHRPSRILTPASVQNGGNHGHA